MNKYKKNLYKITMVMNSTNYSLLFYTIQTTTRKIAIVEYLDYKIPVTQLKGPKGNLDMKVAKRD